MIAAGTRTFALLGDPVGHSLSPLMHNAAFRALGLDAVYVALRCGPDGVAPLLRGLAAAGGGGNVTVPHKLAAAAAVEHLDPAAGGACNTFWGQDGAVHGANTDPDGVLHALDRIGAPSGDWLVLGTGGSARGVLAAAVRRSARLAVRSRQVARAEAFEALARAAGVAPADPAACQVVINATPLGLTADDPIPIALDQVPTARWVLDLVYARGETALVRAARALGRYAADGREALLGQGVAAFRHWFPDRAAPTEVMRAALRDALD